MVLASKYYSPEAVDFETAAALLGLAYVYIRGRQCYERTHIVIVRIRKRWRLHAPALRPAALWFRRRLWAIRSTPLPASRFACLFFCFFVFLLSVCLFPGRVLVRMFGPVAAVDVQKAAAVLIPHRRRLDRPETLQGVFVCFRHPSSCCCVWSAGHFLCYTRTASRPRVLPSRRLFGCEPLSASPGVARRAQPHARVRLKPSRSASWSAAGGPVPRGGVPVLIMPV